MKKLIAHFSNSLLNYSIRTKLIVSFLLVTFIPIAILSYFNILSTRHALIESANQALFSAATKTATDVDSFIRAALNGIELPSRLPDLEAYLQLPPDEQSSSPLSTQVKNVLNSLSSIQRIDGGFSGISSYALLNRQGVVLLDANVISEVGSQESDRFYFQQTLNLQTQKGYASPVEFSRRAAPSIYFSVPVRGADNLHTLGVLRASYSLNFLQELILSSADGAGDNSFAILLDENLFYLAHGADPNQLFTTIGELSADDVTVLQTEQHLPNRPLEQLIVSQPELAQKIASSSTENAIFTVPLNIRGQTELYQIAVVSLETLPWKIIFAKPQSAFLSAIDNQVQASLIFSLAIVGVVLALAVGLSALLAQPIRELTTVAKQVTAGQFDLNFTPRPTTATTADEINILSNAFKQMLTQLRDLLNNLEEKVRERTQQLETTARLSERFNAILDIDQLLIELVDQIKTTFHYYHAQIYLLDHETESLVLVAATGQAGEALKRQQHAIALNKVSLVAKAALSQEIVWVDDVYQDPNWLPNAQLPQTRSEMAVPILQEGKIVGVLDVQSEQLAGLDQGDAYLLRLLAN